MNDSLRLRPVVPALAILMLLPAAGCSFISTNVTQDFHASVARAPSTIEIHNPIGGVDITAWDKPGVQIDATISGASEDLVHGVKISVVPNGSTLVITTDLGSGNGSRQVGYVIHAPAATALKIDQNLGGIDAKGFGGGIDFTEGTGGADVTMAKVAAPQSISIKISVGGIDLTLPDDAAANVTATASIGGIDSTFQLASKRNGLGEDASGVIGNGGATIALTTGTGGIDLKRE
jgi:hypothetical protein